jgi:cytochrome c biogenesis protein CcmG, thiol:disulfide interchange protein DsbE
MSRMNRFVLPLGGFVLLVVLLAVGLKQAPEKGVIKSPLVGKPAPAYVLPNLLEPAAQVRADDYKGRWHLVNVWGSWCYACREEHPVLLAIQRQNVVPIVGIDWNDEEGAGRDWLSKLGNPYVHVGADRDGRTAIAYGVTAAPESFLINPEGVIVKKVTGVITPKVWQEELLPVIRAGGGAS